MHIGASTHAELFRCSKTIGSLVEHHRLNHGMIITGIVYGDFLLLPWAVGGSWAVRLSDILVSAVGCGAPGSASAAGAGGNARSTAAIEHMTKLSKDEVAEPTGSLAEEWEAVLTTTQDSTGAVCTSSSAPVRGRSARHCQRILLNGLCLERLLLLP